MAILVLIYENSVFALPSLKHTLTQPRVYSWQGLYRASRGPLLAFCACTGQLPDTASPWPPLVQTGHSMYYLKVICQLYYIDE